MRNIQDTDPLIFHEVSNIIDHTGHDISKVSEKASTLQILKTSVLQIGTSVINISKVCIAYAICDAVDFGGSYIGIVMIAQQGGTKLLAETVLISAGRSFFFSFSLPALYSAGIMASNLKSEIDELIKQNRLLQIHSPGSSLDQCESNKAIIEEKTRKLAAIFQISLVISFFYSVLGVLISFFISPILQLLRQPKDISESTQSYFRAFIPAFLGYSVLIAQQQFLMGLDKKILVILSNVFNIITIACFDYMLIFGVKMLNIPPLGVVGLALANSFSTIITATLVAIYMAIFLKKYKFWLPNFKNLCNNLKKLLLIGIPIGIQVGSSFTIGLIYTMLAPPFGQISLAALQTALQTTNLLFIPFYSISQGVGILVSKRYGEKDISSAYLDGSVALVVGVGIAILEFIIVLTLPNIIISPFLDNKNKDNHELLRITKYLLYIKATANIIDTVQNVLSGALRGYQDTLIPMFFNVASLVLLGFPLGVGLAYFSNLGVLGFFIGQGISTLIPACVNIIRWNCVNFKEKQKYKKVVDAKLEKPDKQETKIGDSLTATIWNKKPNGETKEYMEEEGCIPSISAVL